MGFSSSSAATGGPGTDRTLRLVIKLAQLLASIYLIVAMYNIGPHWILLVASLAVPLYGLFLLFRSPDRTFRQHPLAYVRYKALARARSWIRVDLAICATMAVVCLAFALVLLLGYFLERSANTFLLHAAVASLLLSLLYSLNAILSVRQLQTGRVDFIMEKQNASSSVSTTRASTQSPIGEPVAGRGERVPTANGHSSPYRAFEDGWQSTQRPLSVSIQSPKSGDEPAGPASLLEQLQSELAAELQAKGGPWRQIPIELPADQRRGQGQGEEAAEVVGRRVERQVKVEQRRSTPFGVDVGAFGSREEQKWTKESGGEQPQHQRQNSATIGSSRWRRGGDAEVPPAESKMLPRLAVQQREGGPRIRGEWSGTVGDRKEQLAAHHLPSPHQPPHFPASASAASSSAPAENDQQQQQQLIKNTELRRTIERKRVRYEAVASKTLVDVDHSPASISPTSAAGGQRIERRDFDVSIRAKPSPIRWTTTELRLRDDRRPTEPHQVTQL